jgi:hypothetical protein
MIKKICPKKKTCVLQEKCEHSCFHEEKINCNQKSKRCPICIDIEQKSKNEFRFKR